MIPDKVYIPKNLAPHLTEEWASHTHGSLDEYIRKDALLEKIDEILSTKPDTNGIAVEIAAQAISDIRKVIDSM